MSTQHALFVIAVISILITFNFAIFNIAFADIGGSALPNAASTCPADAVCLENPLGNSDAARSPQILIGNIIRSVLGVVGSLALVMFIYGGITWMLSGGDFFEIIRGKRILNWATWGLIIIFSAYALVRFIITTVAGSGT